ncbi:mechanosensitive ion channel [Castellaniella daejeonensis]|jgi:small-conductance mechanosensitive channel|uniref:Small-conductance mechanosensitive channel n=1 Tax=Castellaniella daejeonensis TaxID=659013 RepID=A0ABP3DK86_9BURK|nr:mechanosensitive ion channel family protein [Castellaniella sp.]HET8702906.1 mechanosensitive ion channel family protein [Castellaniella sp.]
MEQLQAFWSSIPDPSGIVIHLGVTLAILVVGWAVSNLLGRWMRHIADRSPRIDPTIVPMVRSVTVWAVRIVVLLAVLARLGVQTASLVAMLGASALAIGLALQGTLQNFAAGIMLLVLRPVRAGEFVAIGSQGSGTVDEIGLFMTRFVQADGIQILLPNTLVWGSPITNYSRNKTRRLDMMLGVRYDDDLESALATLKALVDRHDGILGDPAPQVMVMEYRESTIMVNIRVWTPAEKYWDVYFDLHRRAPQELRQAGLRSPIPLREVQSIPAPAPENGAANG